MLWAEPSLAAHVSEAKLEWGADTSRRLAGHVSSLSSLTKLMLPSHDPVLESAGMLHVLRQLSLLQSLNCLADIMQTLLEDSVPRSWPLLTELQRGKAVGTMMDACDSPDWSLVEQQCPQLQALAMDNAIPLCLTALTSLTCQYWLPQHTGSFQCAQLRRLHVLWEADLSLLPSALTSLSLSSVRGRPFAVMRNLQRDLQHQHLRSQQFLVHICFASLLPGLSSVQGLMPALHTVLATSVTSVELSIHPRAFSLPNPDGSMAGQHFHNLGVWFPQLQRLHIHLHCRPPAEGVLISAAWLPAHCRLVVTHKFGVPVRIVKYPPGCMPC